MINFSLKRFFIIGIIGISFFKCHVSSNEIETLRQDAVYLATLQCEAKAIQKERFALAKEKIKLEDSILLFQNEPQRLSNLQNELIQFDVRAEDVWKRTKVMADSIQFVLDSFWDGIYKDTADRRHLDTALMEAYHRICPDSIQNEE